MSLPPRIMHPARFSLLLNVAGALLAVAGATLRLNHLISFGLCFALMTAAMLATWGARRVRKTLH
ncbi:hypothetical protein I2I05_11825 [Hymenobacter sp. BT683]|uniref:Uncharacterized protein n=1 Tax=Hymenobacter jeongseonensis TaxID=2791027 RepID=A0ABS0IJ90_9BACT|nr:hypothetical protein [Hymenobacter jeongseonensis]MBF9238084.1 hypothetical protein [Hymenobacter jeongseonensis]